MTRCIICGADIYTPDYYGQIRRKYCTHCAAEMKREQKRAWQSEYRRAKREQNAQVRQLCEVQKAQIEEMRKEILRLRESLDKQSNS